jgi:hypothetical protein
MVDPQTRRLLSLDVRRLVTGRMTNDAFDDVYYETYERSDDRAVREIATFCYSLYSSDLLLPYRLRGRHSVDDETRSTAARSVLFLRSNFEYAWPPFPDNFALRVLAGLAMFLGLPGGIALLLICIPLELSGPDSMTAPLAIIAAFLLVGSAALAFYWPRFLRTDWQSFKESGDYDVWPFIRRKDFDTARQSCQMFAN